MGYVRRLLTSRPYKSTHFPSRQIGISGPGHSCRGPVQLISDPAGARSSVHRCTHTIHTRPQAAPSACTLMFNHMRCRPSGAAAPRPSSVLPSVPPDPRRAPGLQPSPGTTGARGIGAGCPPGRRPGRMQSPRACWPSLRPCARVHVLSKLTYYFRSSVRGVRGLRRLRCAL